MFSPINQFSHGTYSRLEAEHIRLVDCRFTLKSCELNILYFSERRSATCFPAASKGRVELIIFTALENKRKAKIIFLKVSSVGIISG